MQIKRIHIDGFGVWHGKTWSGLASGMNVFHGANEAGKTTLMGFIRSILFGFERRAHPGRYEPVNGGRYGGWLEVSDRGARLRIERKASRHVRGRVKIRPAESEWDGPRVDGEDEARLDQMLGGTTRTLYHNVFAFGLEELEHFRTLEESEVASHVSGAGMGVGASRWSRVWKDIEVRRSRLFLPRGQNSAINRALKELESVHAELDQTESQPEAYVRAHEERARLEIEIGRLVGESERRRKWIDHCKRLKAAEPHLRRRVLLRQAIDRLEPVEEFPDGGVERLNLLLYQRRELEAELDRQREESERLRRERLELVSSYTPQELLRLGRVVESLRHLLPRRESVEARIVQAQSQCEAMRIDRDNRAASREARRPPSNSAVGIFLAVVLCGAGGLFLADHRLGAWTLVGPLVLFLWWYYGRARSWRAMLADVESAQGRMEKCEAGLAEVLEEGRRIASSIERLVGRSDVTWVELERENVRLSDLNQTADRIRSIDEALSGEQRHLDRIRTRIEANEQAVTELFRKGGAVSETEFFRRAELFAERSRLENELARIPVPAMSADPELRDVDPNDSEAFSKMTAEWAQVESELTEARTQVGRLDERINVLGRSDERARSRGREESVLARVDSAAEEWAVLTLCRALLEDTRKIYETERQPEVLEHASRFFSKMTEGSWTRVIASLDSSQILVESNQAERVSPERLSRGTAEQLYLAMRLALVREYSSHVKPLPVILDDVLVNFDPDRMRRTVEAIGELSQTHQILFFTCHPHLVGMVEEIVPGAEIYPLQ